MKRRIAILCSCLLLVLTACGQKAADNASLPSETTDVSFANFQTVDLDGNTVDQAIFADYDLTLVNIWATFCGNCIDEMPDLATLNETYHDQGFQVVGLVLDAYPVDGAHPEDIVELAKDIIEQTGADYLQLLPSIELAEVAMAKSTAVPYSFFVDKDGNEVGDGYLGAKDLETWQTIIEQQLEEVK